MSKFQLIAVKKRISICLYGTDQQRKSKDYVYGIRVYKVLGIWKGYYRVKKNHYFMHEIVNRGKK